MKKLFSLIIVLTLTMAMLVACGGPTPTEAPPAAEPTEAPAAEKPTEAPMAEEPTEAPAAAPREFHVQGAARTVPGQEDAWKEVIAAFEKEYNVKVTVRWEGLWSDIPQNLETARMAGEPVDITTCGANQINSTLVRSGIIMDITDYITPIKDRFVGGMIDPYTIDGKIWAMPWDVASSSVVFYNKTMFDELGLAEPKTFADVVNASKVIKEQKGIIPWIHQGKAPWMWPMWFFEAFAQTAGNKSLEFTSDFLSGKRNFSSPEEIAAFADLAKFYSEGVMTQESLDTDTDGMRAAFAQQKAAMMYVGSWEFPNVRDQVKDFEVGMFEFPLLTDDPNVVSQHGGGPDGCLAVPSFAPPENVDLQAQFLEFVSRKEPANKILGPAQGFISVVKSVPPVDDPLSEELATVFVPHTIKFLDWIWPVEVNDAVMNAIPAVMVGEITPEDAAASVQKAYETLVAEKNYSFDWWTQWTDADWAKVKPSKMPTFDIKE